MIFQQKTNNNLSLLREWAILQVRQILQDQSTFDCTYKKEPNTSPFQISDPQDCEKNKKLILSY